jgi:hypothetical protein
MKEEIRNESRYSFEYLLGGLCAMTDTKEPVERRKHKRFKVLSDAFVILKPSDTVAGRIIDISMDGLTFEYFAGKGQAIQPTELEIIAVSRTFRLTNIPCQAIRDLVTYDSPLTTIKGKRCGVQFGELTEAEKSRLGYFIENHTTAAPASQSMSDEAEERRHIERRFGIIAVEEGFITHEELLKALSAQVMDDLEGKPHRLIGEILHDQGAMTRATIAEVLLTIGVSEDTTGPQKRES